MTVQGEAGLYDAACVVCGLLAVARVLNRDGRVSFPWVLLLCAAVFALCGRAAEAMRRGEDRLFFLCVAVFAVCVAYREWFGGTATAPDRPSPRRRF